MPPSAPSVDPDGDTDAILVQQAKTEIRTLVREIAQLAQSDVTAEEFYAGFLPRVVSALAAVGGAIWTLEETGTLRLRQHVNLSESQLSRDPVAASRHAQLLKETAATGQPALISPDTAGDSDDRAANPTAFLLVLGPIQSHEGLSAIVEIFQRPGGSPVTHRGYLRFLVQMCGLADDFLRNRHLRRLQRREADWCRTEEFLHAIQRRLDLRAVAYAVANEGRRLIAADRLSVLVPRRGVWAVLAVSGLDTIDPRAASIVRLSELAQAVCRGGEPLWFLGSDEERPPQIEAALQGYLDACHTRAASVIPLHRPADMADGEPAVSGPPIGALVVEHFTAGEHDDEYRRRVATVAEYGGAALNNALEHHQLFLLPVWRTAGRVWSALRGRRRVPSLTAAAGATIIALALALVPAELRIGASGTLEPVVQRHVFAEVDGTVVEVPVTHAQSVAAGAVLARMRNIELELRITALTGQQATTEQELHSLRQLLLKPLRLSEDERNRLAGRVVQLKETLESVACERRLLLGQEEQLVVRSPRSGQVATWQVQEQLLRRPVQKGQLLMSVIDPDSDWELELAVPECDAGHVIAAWQAADHSLPVKFALPMHPGRELIGRVVELQRTAGMHDGLGSAMRVRVALDRDQLPERYAGATVDARIHCGRRAVGFVWFRELIETVQAKRWLWW